MKKLLALLLVLALCFTCFAACKGKVDEKPVDNSKPTEVVYDVEDAVAYLKNMYKKYLVEIETAADYTLVSQVMKGGVVYKITWTTDRDDIKVIEDAENKQVKIDLNEKTKVDIKYTLTATITDPDGKTATLTFELKVPKYVLSTWKEYMAMEAGKAVVIEGYVAAIHSQSEGQKYNMLYVHDVNNAGGYYIYSMTADPIKDLNLKRGMLVSVTGTKDIYSGTHEIKDASVNVLDTKVVDFAPVDITNIYKAANSLSDEALVSKLGMYVTIKGVEITDQNLAEKSQYYNFKLAGLTSYIRLYRTDCPESVSDADMKAIANGHTAKKGYYADVSGIVVLYNGSIYLNPVSKDCFKYGAFIKRTDAEKVQVEMDEIKFDKDVPINKTLTLPSKGKSYENVVITWKSNSDAIEIKDGKAYIKLQAEATTASMTATFTLGTITKTKTYTFNLAKKPSVVAQQVTNPVANTAYKLYMVQLNRGETLYFTGEMNGHYGASTTDYNEAVDVYVETTNNGYFMYFNKGGEKNYINIVPNGTYINFVFQTDKPSAPFAVEATTGAPTLKIGNTTYYIATYNNYNTFGTTKYPDSSFLGYLGTMVDTTKISDADKVAKEKEALSISATNFSTDSSIDLKGAGTTYDDVKITWASNNACAVVADGKLNVTLQETAQTVTLTATLTCGTATATKTFNITVDAKPSVVPVVVDTPIAGTAYKLYLVQANLMNKGLYFIGTSANEVHYLSTSTNYTEGVDVFVEIPEAGKYYLYFMDGTAKKYLTIKLVDEGDYIRARALIVDEADKGTAFIWNAENKTFYMEQLNDTKEGLNDFYMGTYGTHETISASKTGYISTSFPAHLVTMVDTSSITDADKVAAEKETLSVEDEFFTDAEIDLTVKGVTYEDVTITWASNSSAAVVNGDKLTITVGDEKQTVTLTATLKLGNVTETKTFTIVVNAKTLELTSIADANAIGAEKGHNEYTSETYYVAGVISQIANATYGNAYIVDEFGNSIYIYGLYDSTGATRYDALTTKPQVGDYIVVASPIGKYNDNVQLKNAKIMEHIATTSITEANTIGAAQPNKGAATTEKYLVTGEITTAPDSQYGNCTIKDAEGNTLTVYGMYNSTGETRYDALTTKPQAGDTVTLYGVLSNYNGPQIKNACIYGYVAGTPSGDDEGQMTITSIVDAIAIGAAKGHNEYTTENHYVAGVITEIVSTKYGNTYITDEFGNTIYTYGLYDSTGATRYDSMTVKPQVGDYIVVSAPIGKYNDVIQLKNPKLVEHIAATSITEANTIGAAQPDKGAATTDKYLVTGEITTAPDSKYGNCTIKDTEGNTLTVYGMYNSTGETRYDALTTKPQAGDTVTLYGVLSNYNGPQIKNAWIYGYVAGTPSGGEGGEGEGGEGEGGQGGTSNASTATSFSPTTFAVNTNYGAYESSDGWSTKNCQVLIPTSQNNSLAVDSVVLNGKTGAQGVLTSCLYANGIKSLSFKYGLAYSDTSFDLSIKIKDSTGAVVASTTLNKTGLAKGFSDNHTWTLDTPVSGDFTIEFANLGTNSGNKHRVSLWDIAWVNNN